MIAHACKGDMREHFTALETILEKYFAQPGAWVYLKQAGTLSRVFGHEKVLSLLAATRKKVYSDKSLEYRNQMLLHLDLEIESIRRHLIASNSGQPSCINPVIKWIINGPYYRYGYSDLWHTFVPEISGSMASLVENGKKINAGQSMGLVGIDEVIAEDGGIIFASSSFPAKGNVKIRVYSNSEYVLKINGKMVVENTKASVLRTCRIVQVNAQKGITIMLKMRNRHDRYFRVLVTDHRDMMIPVQYTNDLFTSTVEYMESMDYPFGTISRDIQQKNEYGLRRMGMYYENLKSMESYQYYREAFMKSTRDYDRARLIAVLLNNSSNNEDSAELKLASDFITASAASKSACIPFRFQYARLLAVSGENKKAIREGVNIASEAPAYFPLYEPLVRWCTAAGRIDLITRFLSLVKKQFPHYGNGKLMEAEFLRFRDPERCENICRNILSEKYCDDAESIMIDVLSARQKYAEMIKVAEKFGNEWMYMERLFHGYMALEKYAACRTFLMNEIVKRNNMMGLYYLGMMEIILGEDTDLYWDKLIQEKPEWYWFRKRYSFYRAISGKGSEDGESIPIVNNKTKHTKYISMNREFRITGSGYCEVKCHDLLYTGTASDYQERTVIQVPFSGDTIIRKLKATKNGVSYSILPEITHDDERTVISFSGIKPDTLISCTFDVYNALDDRLGDRFVTLKRVPIANSPYPVDAVNVSIMYPQDMHLDVTVEGALNTRDFARGEYKLFEAEFKKSNDAKINFTNCQTWQDFGVVFKGIVKKSGEEFHMANILFPGNKDVRSLIRNVYNRVQRNISLKNGDILNVRRSVDVLSSGKGTVAEKAVLAKYMLEGKGVKSYLAFTMKRGSESFYGKSANYGRIERVMLYVPLNNNDSVWLDFSNHGHDAGVLHQDVDGAETIVLAGDTVEWMIVGEN
ncbi:MAG: tetratricopeptide repeat protein [Spirochaetota bacterium]